MKRLASSKLTSKFQATVPQAAKSGQKRKGHARLDEAYLKGLDRSLDEWNSKEDEKAYKTL